MSHVGTTSPFLPLPDGIVIASVHPTASRLVVQARLFLFIPLLIIFSTQASRLPFFEEEPFGYHKHLWISNEIKPYRVFRNASGMISFIYIRRKNETKSLLETCSYYH